MVSYRNGHKVKFSQNITHIYVVEVQFSTREQGPYLVQDLCHIWTSIKVFLSQQSETVTITSQCQIQCAM